MLQFHQKSFLNNKTRKKLYTHATLLVPKKLKYKKWQLHLIAPMFKCPPRKFGFPLLDRVIWYLGWKKLHSFSSFIYLICYTFRALHIFQHANINWFGQIHIDSWYVNTEMSLYQNCNVMEHYFLCKMSFKRYCQRNHREISLPYKRNCKSFFFTSRKIWLNLLL